jgi:hypothetical protein
MAFPRNVPTEVVNLDKPRTIALTLDALLRLEEATGQPLMGISMDASQIVKSLDAWIWAGLDDDDRAEISRDDVRQMIHIGNLTTLLGVVTQLITSSVPEKVEGKPIPAPPKVQRAAAGKS